MSAVGSSDPSHASALRVAAPPTRPLLIYDGDCNFCRRWVGRWRQITGDAVDYAPSQTAGEQYPEIDPARFREAVQLIEPTGEVFSGAQAVFRTLAKAPRRGWPLMLYRRVPGVPALSEAAYAFVAAHRRGFSTLTRLLWGQHLDPPSYRIAQGLFLRGMGGIYLIAFVSLWLQVDGLIGSGGILPVHDWLGQLREHLGPERYRLLPTLCWFGDSDRALHVLCAVGTAAALSLTLGLLPMAASILCWLVYLSFFYAGNVFLQFQWDLLLLEAGFLAVLLSPAVVRSRFARDRPAPRLVRFLLLFLLFKLMFSSGVVKLSSQDPTWRALDALRYHYETQPLPPWTAWHAHRLPAWIDTGSVAIMFIIELAFPFLIMGPRRLRHVACAGFILLQLGIAVTGNYCFFNLLTMLLCVPLLDDASWPLRWQRWLLGPPEAPAPVAGRWRARLTMPVALVIVAIGALNLVQAFRVPLVLPAPIEKAYDFVAPLRLSNSYGLFATMTTRRLELVIEGSNDRRHWSAYEFKWKPGDVSRRPAFVAPHQPRLDWQLWFVPLSPQRQNMWLFHFIARLFENSPPVTGLLEGNPFPDEPPRYIRVLVYDYHFSDAATRRDTGAWWTRELKGLYCPVLSADMLRPARNPSRP